jgi:GTP cyclohydrolase I
MGCPVKLKVRAFNGSEENLAVQRVLATLGEDPTREGLRDTPRRFMKMMREMTEGYDQRADEVLGTVFTEACDEMVVVRDIPFWSLCEHHLMPFHGTATVGYLPQGKVVGLSKLPRLVLMHARRLQVQERMTRSIAHDIERVLCPGGVGVVIQAHHTCMAARGVRSDGAMVTSSMLGGFLKDARIRSEFLALARK